MALKNAAEIASSTHLLSSFIKGEPGQRIWWEQYPTADILLLFGEAVALT